MKSLLILMAMAILMIIPGCTDTADDKDFNETIPKQLEKFPSFTAKDLAGNQVTNEIFAAKKLTVVNIWGTFCPPCIAEMPELASWSKSMPTDIQLVGIICDIQGQNDSQTIQIAKDIIADANADFLNIIPNVEIINYLTKVDAVPTTIFVNTNGEVLSEIVVGADVDRYKQIVNDYLKN